MPRHLARNVPKALADKFDEVVAEGPSEPVTPPPPPPRPIPDPDPSRATEAALAALQEAFDDLREDVRQGLAAAASVQFDALAPVRAALEQLVARPEGEGPAVNGSAPIEALREEIRRLASRPAATPDLTAVKAQLDQIRQEIQRAGSKSMATPTTAVATTSSDLSAIKSQLEQIRQEIQRTGSKPTGTPTTAVATTSPDLSAIKSQLELLRQEIQRAGRQAGGGATSPVTGPPPDLSAIKAQVELLRQEIQRDRGHRDALRSAVLEAVGTTGNEMQAVRALLEQADTKATAAALTGVREALNDLRLVQERDRGSEGAVHLDVMRTIEAFRRDLGEQIKERDAREADIETMVMGLDAGLKAARQSIESIAKNQADPAQLADAMAGAQNDLMRTLEAFHDELVEQWRQRKVFESSVPPVLDGLRTTLAEGVAQLSAGIGFLPAAVEARLPAPAPPVVQSNDEVLQEVAALRGELASRAGDLDSFLRTAVSGANRWFVQMRDELYRRVDQFAAAIPDGQLAVGGGDHAGGGEAGGQADNQVDNQVDTAVLMSAIESLRADVRELHTYLGMVDSNLQRFHDAVAPPTPKPKPKPRPKATRPPASPK